MTDQLNEIREALEPCPFCGHIGLDFADGSTYRWGVASSSGCGATCGEVRRDYPDTGEWKAEAIAAWNRRAPRLEAAAAAEYERGRQDGMKQEHALWKLAQAGQDIEAAAVPEPDGARYKATLIFDHETRVVEGAIPLTAAAVPELSREDVVRWAREASQYANAEYPRRRFAREDVTWWQLRDERFASLARSVPVGEVKPVAWEGGEGWEALAWHLCAEENGEDACTELVWEGGPVPEPWGDRWMKYEDEAKRLIALVHKYTNPPAPIEGWRMVQEDRSDCHGPDWTDRDGEYLK